MASQAFAAPGLGAWRGAALALAGLAALAAACDIPSTPKWDVRFRIPVDTIRRTPVEDVLPIDVRPTADSSAFEVGLQTTTFSKSLGELCPACPSSVTAVPYPGFVGTLSGGINLPSDVISVTLVGGQITVRITNTFSFDPLRPPNAAGPGYVVITARSGTVELAKDSIDTRNGPAVALPPNGGLLERTFAVQGGLVSQSIVVDVKIGSPAGGPISLDRNQRLSVVAEGTNARVSEASVRVTERAIEREQIIVDLSDIDESVRDRVQGGEFLIELANPFNVEGPFDVRIGAPGTTITRTIQVPPGPGTDTVRVALTRDELRGIIGQESVVVEAVGTLSSTSAPGFAVVRPRQVFVVVGYFDIVLRVPEE
ncbi:MAG TPA: hypothetical protein VKA84_14705 [Gemmatimonadaceae bacterium]|nr:hypothetical protein [Gemmatimonadaceae bacterium]